MRLEAVLHLPDGVLRLAVAAGEVAEVPAAAVPNLVGRVDRRDRLHLDGRRLDRRTTAGRVRAGFAFVTGTAVAADVSVRDHLAAGTSTRAADALLAETPLLRGRGGDLAGVLSGGERRVLAVLRAAAAQPRAVLLDAAGEGLDPSSLAWVGAQVARWRDAGTAVVVRVGRPEERTWSRPSAAADEGSGGDDR